ncbi:MAG TPA: SGNH/GDSL hydrolase family protein [Streptosporangiaceae bacterium]
MNVRLAAVALILSITTVLTGCSADSTARLQPGGAGKRVSVVAFLGDSYTAGIGDTTRDQTYAALTAQRLGWQVIVAGQAGTGLLAPGHDGHTFGQLYERQLAWRPAPDMAVIVGGHNDWPYPQSLEETSAARLVNQMRQRWPRTHLLMVGPMWGSGEPRTEVLSIRDALKSAAAQENVPFIDPLAEQWVTGSRDSGTGNAPRFILKDNTHPNAAGHRYFADRLVADLRKLGLTEPVAGVKVSHPNKAGG